MCLQGVCEYKKSTVNSDFLGPVLFASLLSTSISIIRQSYLNHFERAGHLNMHFSLFRKNKHSLPSESPDRSKYSPLHQQTNAPIRTKPNYDPNVRPTHSTHPVGFARNKQPSSFSDGAPNPRPVDHRLPVGRSDRKQSASVLQGTPCDEPNDCFVGQMQKNRANFIQNSVHHAGQNDPKPGFRPSEKKQQSHPQSGNRNPIPANPGPPVPSDDQQAMFFQNNRAHPKAVPPKPPVKRVDQRQPSVFQSQNPYPKPTAPEGSTENGETEFLQPSKVFPKHSLSGQKSAYQEVHDRMLQARPDDMKVIERNNATSPQELLIWLKSENQIHMDQHKFRSGFNKVKPYMSALMSGVDFGSVFTAFDSTGIASLAVGLFKSTLGVAISLCEASANLEDKIQILVSKIVLVNKYNRLADRAKLELMHESLVGAYETLFQFFFKVFDLLRKGCFLTRAIAGSSEISSLITTFEGKCAALGEAAGFEQLKLKIDEREEKYGKRSDEEIKIFLALGEGKQAEEVYEKDMHLGNRAQGGCEWIHSTTEFRDWFEHNKTKFLAMFGEPGSGKTTTAAYVIEALRNQRAHGTTEGVIVCSFYCRDEESRNNSKKIWSSLLAQIVDGRPKLQDWLLRKLKDPITESIEAPKAEFARELFVEAVGAVETVEASKARVFMILDGLDEALQEARTTISNALEELSQKPLFKAFLTFRESHEIMKDMPQGCGKLRHRNTLKENLAIAQHHVDAKFSKRRLGPEDRKQIIRRIAQKAEGNPVWIQMMVEYLDERTLRSQQENLRVIDEFPSQVAGVYGKTYEKMAKKLGTQYLVPPLQILAVACRPLTMRELSEAVALVLGMEPNSIDSFKIYDSARPFIRVDQSVFEEGISTEKLDSAVVRLIHQSLKELILAQEPHTWTKGSGDFAQTPPSLHVARLDMMLARACIAHLQEEQYRQDLDIRLYIHTPKEGMEKKRLPTFFQYAASFWAHHFTNADSQGAIPHTLISASAKICQQSIRLVNWTSMFMITSGLRLPSNPDHLTIASFFNHPSSLMSILDRSRDGIRGSQLGQALYWAALGGSTSCVDIILERRDLFQPAESMMYGESPLHAAAKSGNPKCLNTIIDSELFDIHQRTRQGRNVLSLAAQEGQIAKINVLLSERVDLNTRDNSNRTPLYWAIQSRSSAAVEVLLAQPDINLTTVAETEDRASSGAWRASALPIRPHHPK
ncbi:hypothetical protein HDK90DRAFT_186595 [Phyllosticta capitalensis]|uniref:NACHT domain-containing protein n=1 Tax=Phyllosticta capitalensis TaxID=121624 RepID=A0ABR1YWT8_9PEZI